MNFNNDPQVSVITVVLNDAVGLTRTIESVQEQLGIRLEHVIVDGGSTDGSAVLAEKNSDVKIESRPDGGIYQAMQRGLDAASGAYIIFTNAGDALFGTSYLANAVDDLTSADKSWGFGPLVEESLRGSTVWTPVSGEISLPRIAFRKTYVPFPTVVVSSDLVRGVGGFSQSYSIAGDFDLIVRLSLQELPIRWDYPVARFAAGGISYTKAPLAWSEERQIRRNSLELSGLQIARDWLIGRKKLARWQAGKFLDALQNIGVLGNQHWRDRRATEFPSQYLSL